MRALLRALLSLFPSRCRCTDCGIALNEQALFPDNRCLKCELKAHDAWLYRQLNNRMRKVN